MNSIAQSAARLARPNGLSAANTVARRAFTSGMCLVPALGFGYSILPTSSHPTIPISFHPFHQLLFPHSSIPFPLLSLPPRLTLSCLRVPHSRNCCQNSYIHVLKRTHRLKQHLTAFFAGPKTSITRFQPARSSGLLMSRNMAANLARHQTRGVVTETISVGAAIMGAGKLIGAGTAAAGLIGTSQTTKTQQTVTSPTKLASKAPVPESEWTKLHSMM